MTDTHSQHDRAGERRMAVWLLGIVTLIFALSPLFPEEHWLDHAGYYLPVHTAMEFFAVTIAVLVFAVGWNAHVFRQSLSLTLLSCGFLAVAIIDFVHTMSFQGMPAFITPPFPGKAIAFWLGARFVAALTLLSVALISWQKESTRRARHGLLVASLATAIIVCGIGLFHPEWLPTLLIPGKGLTAYKVGAEYMLFALHALVAILLWRRIGEVREVDVLWLAAAVWLMGLSELFLAPHDDVTDLSNLLGHLYKVAAYAMVYRSVFVNAIRQPYERLDNARRELAASEARYGSIISQATDAVIVTDESQRIQVFNAAAEQIFGYPAEKVLGRALDMLMPEQFVSDHREWVQKFGLSGATRRAIGRDKEVLARRASGEVFPAEVSIARTSAGLNTYFTAILRDVSERHKVDERLRRQQVDLTARVEQRTAELTALNQELVASTARLNEAQRIAHIGSWDLDLANNKLIWSDEIFRIFEIDQAGFGASYEAFLNGIHPDDRDMVNRAYTDSVANKTPYEITHRLKMPDGRIKYVSEHCETFYDASGKPIRSTGTVQDITKLALAEEEVRRHRGHLEELVKQRTTLLHEAQRIAHLGHWNWDVTTGDLTWSDEIYRIFGYRPGAFLPTYDRFIATLHPADVERIKQSEHDAFSRGERHSIDHRILLPNGEERWVHEEAIATVDANGKPISLSGTVQDITERKKTEQALIAAKEEAERASRAKSEFLSRMSHELRTPMNAILGFAQVLEVEPLSPEQKNFVHEIHEAGDHLLLLINDLLDLARIDAGRLATAVEPVTLGKIAEQAIQMVKPLVAQKKLALLNKCDPELTVLADATRLKQILVNLLSNAAKYNRQGGSIRLDCRLLDHEHLRLAVTDTGPGIAAEKLDQLFRPFERLGAEATGIDGTGIGLAISKRLAELMGGTLGVDTTPGQGSTFWIDLPRAEGRKAAASTRTGVPAADPNRRKVLYVEDKAANLKVVEAVLRRQPNVTLLSATNGEYGLELAARYKPDVILLDIHLPGMDGYAVLRQLRSNPDTRRIPVIALSADAMPIDVERGLAAGFLRYLTKPVSLPRLMEALEQVMTGRG